MKHSFKVTLLLVVLFFSAQVIGLYILKEDVSSIVVLDSGESIVEHKDLPGGFVRPEKSSFNYFPILLGILLGTGFLLFIIKLKRVGLWKFWFALSVFACLVFALKVLVGVYIALFIAALLTYFKIFKSSIITHNITELLIYAGLAVIFVPILDITAAFILLIAISLYDMFAVWQSKHMIKLAKFQTDSGLFAGLFVPYKGDKISINSLKKTSPYRGKKSNMVEKTAILGGGDIAFPLLFSGVVMESLLIIPGFTLLKAFFMSLTLVLFSTIALITLFYFSKKNRFYPAMPFLSLGCFLGYFFLLFFI